MSASRGRHGVSTRRAPKHAAPNVRSDQTRIRRANTHAAPRGNTHATRLTAVTVALLAVVLGLSGSASADKGLSGAAAELPAGAVSLFSVDEEPANVTTHPDWSSVELGLRFSASVDGQLVGLRYFRSVGDDHSHAGRLWDSSGDMLARLTFPALSSAGWQYQSFATPVDISAGEAYIASYHTSNGYAAEISYFDDQPITQGDLSTAPGNGDGGSVYAYGWPSRFPSDSYRSTNYWIDPVYVAETGSLAPITPAPIPTPTPSPSPTPSPTPTPSPSPAPTPSPTPIPPPNPIPPPPSSSGAFPGPSNTGVPAGVSLTTYTGPMTITQAGTVIDAKVINGTVVIAAPNVTITRSKIIGNIDSDSGGVSVTILDSEVDGGTSQAPAIGYSNITMARVNVHGSRVSVLCGTNCQIADSWLHDQYIAPGSDWHINGYVSNGGSNVLLSHNTIACDVGDNSNGGGCTGPAASFGDFAPLRNIVYDNNLFIATPGGYCLAAGYNPSKPFGSDPTGIVVTNNVFQRGPSGVCGYYGAVTAFPRSGAGNVFANNVYDDGRPVTL